MLRESKAFLNGSRVASILFTKTRNIIKITNYKSRHRVNRTKIMNIVPKNLFSSRGRHSINNKQKKRDKIIYLDFQVELLKSQAQHFHTKFTSPKNQNTSNAAISFHYVIDRKTQSREESRNFFLLDFSLCKDNNVGLCCSTSSLKAIAKLGLFIPSTVPQKSDHWIIL